MNDRPVPHALVGYFFAPFGLCSEPRIMPLDEAVEYARVGYVVFVDPSDEQDLARWEQMQRSLTTRARSWLGD